MLTSLYIIQKYWIKHKKNLMTLIFSSVLMTSIILVFWLIQRETNNRFFYNNIYSGGKAEFTVFNSNDELMELVAGAGGNVKTASVYKYGEFGDNTKFVYGTARDPYNILRITFEDGRMPKSKSELAVDRAVLEKLFWAGKCGDTITFNGKTFTVTGITNIAARYGSALGSNIPHCIIDGREMENCAVLPLIFIAEPEGEPLARIDYFTGIVDKRLTTEQAENSEEFTQILDLLMENIDHTQSCFIWNFIGSGTIGGNYSTANTSAAGAYSLLFAAGALVAAQSVFTVLRTIFRERSANITILKRLGMSRRRRIGMYAVECAAITLFQMAAGFLVGTAAYEIILLFRTVFLGEEYISGFTTDIYVTSRSFSPFPMTVLMSLAIMITAYILNIFTTKVFFKTPPQKTKPRSLRSCFNITFRDGVTTVVQTICLAVICVSVTLSYMGATLSGKYIQSVMLGAPSEELSAGGIDMKKANVAEYYFCEPPSFAGISMEDNFGSGFYSAPAKYESGIDDDTAAQLPSCAYAAGLLRQPFIIGDGSNNSLENKIDFSNENVRKLFFSVSAEKYSNFFDEGQLGSKDLYQAVTCLADEKLIGLLSEYVRNGRINIDALNNGSEILAVSCTQIPPFKAGDSYTFASAVTTESGFGVENITVTDPVKIGAVIRLPDNAEELVKRLATTDETSCPYNFLTTAKGADAMGLDSARYTEIFSTEAMDGGLLPFSAHMQLTSINALKRDAFINRVKNSAAIILILTVMSLLGFSAYFNGIGMKIRQKAYEISVLRAEGISLGRIRKILLSQSLKIPLIASAAAYLLIKVAQLSANSLADKWDELWTVNDEFVHSISETFVMRNNWWQVNLEVPVLVLWAVFSAVTVLLTFSALKKFGKNIANDLNEGRKRQ